MNFYQRWRVKRDIARLTFEEASAMMRTLAYAGVQSPIVLWLAERALSVAPEGRRYNMMLWVRMLRAGRTIKVKTFEVTVPDEDLEADDELVRAVEESFIGWDE